MASTSSSNGNITITQSQEETQKRSAEEETNQNAESKRQKKMFAQRKVIGPRDILVNSNLPKIKLEEDVGCSPTAKLEPLEIENPLEDSSHNISLPFGERAVQTDQNVFHDDNVVDVDNEMAFSDMQYSESSTEIGLQSEDDRFQENHTRALTRLIEQKDEEIKALFKVFKGLQHQLNDKDTILSGMELENEQFAVIDSNIRKDSVLISPPSDVARVVTNLTSDLMEKQAKTRILSMKILKLQDKLFGTASYKLEVNKNYKALEDFVQESFKLIIPFLYNFLELNDILTCRIVCTLWRDASDTFLSSHPSRMPFDNETDLEEKRKLELGRMPILDESHLQKLAKAHTFSDVGQLKQFNSDNRRTIIGSKIYLDNINLISKQNAKTIAWILKRFDVHIKYLVIRECVELPDFKSRSLIDHVKLCLNKLPNLRHLKLVFSVDREKIKRKNGYFILPGLKNKICSQGSPYPFPNLENLESLELTLESWEGFSEHASFLENFSVSLVQPYSEKLKNLSIFTPGIDTSDCLVFPNLKELSLPQSQLYKMKFICQHVEKCTITSFPQMVSYSIIGTIRRQFPKLTNLGFKLEVADSQLIDQIRIACCSQFNISPEFPKIPNILTLQLENCTSIRFKLLDCFPNLRYIKFIRKCKANNTENSEREHDNDDINDSGSDSESENYSSDFDDNFVELEQSRQTKYRIIPSMLPPRLPKEEALEIVDLLKDMNLYKCIQFWEHFPNVSLVTVEFSDEQMTNVKPKLYRWTRRGYSKYSEINNQEGIV